MAVVAGVLVPQVFKHVSKKNLLKPVPAKNLLKPVLAPILHYTIQCMYAESSQWYMQYAYLYHCTSPTGRCSKTAALQQPAWFTVSFLVSLPCQLYIQLPKMDYENLYSLTASFQTFYSQMFCSNCQYICKLITQI